MDDKKKSEIRKRINAKFKNKPLPKAPTKSLPPVKKKEPVISKETIINSDEGSDTDSERSKFRTLSSQIPSISTGSQEIDIDDVLQGTDDDTPTKGYRKDTFRIHSSNEQAIEECANEHYEEDDDDDDEDEYKQSEDDDDDDDDEKIDEFE